MPNQTRVTEPINCNPRISFVTNSCLASLSINQTFTDTLLSYPNPRIKKWRVYSVHKLLIQTTVFADCFQLTAFVADCTASVVPVHEMRSRRRLLLRVLTPRRLHSNKRLIRIGYLNVIRTAREKVIYTMQKHFCKSFCYLIKVFLEVFSLYVAHFLYNIVLVIFSVNVQAINLITFLTFGLYWVTCVFNFLSRFSHIIMSEFMILIAGSLLSEMRNR